MIRAITFHLRAAIVFLSLLFLFCLAPETSAQTTTEVRLRVLVERFFGGYSRKDLDGAMSIWSKNSPDLAAITQRLRRAFAANDKIEFNGLTIKEVKVDGDKAAMRLVVDMKAVDARTGKSAIGVGRINRTFRFVREDDEWKAWQYVSSEEELAAALVQAKTDSDREALLAAEKELLTADLVQALNARGRVFSNQGQYEAAIPVHNLALLLAERLNDKVGVVRTLNSIGTVFYYQGDYSDALSSYRKGLLVAEESNDPSLLAPCLANIGLIYDAQGDYARAFEYYHKGLKLHEQLGNKASIARSLNNLGIVHRLLGNYAQAQEYLHNSLKLKQELGDPLEISSTLSNIGEVYTAEGKYDQAAEYLQKSLRMSESLSDKAGIAQTLGNLGNLSGLQGNHERALEYFQKNLEHNRALGDKAAIAQTLYNIAEANLSKKNFAQALEMANNAATLAKQIQFSEIFWRANATAGRAHKYVNQPDRARECFLTAIDTIEELRGQVGGGEQEQQRFLESRLSPYYGMVDLLVEHNKDAEASAQGNKARAWIRSPSGAGRDVDSHPREVASVHPHRSQRLVVAPRQTFLPASGKQKPSVACRNVKPVQLGRLYYCLLGSLALNPGRNQGYEAGEQRYRAE